MSCDCEFRMPKVLVGREIDSPTGPIKGSSVVHGPNAYAQVLFGRTRQNWFDCFVYVKTSKIDHWKSVLYGLGLGLGQGSPSPTVTLLALALVTGCHGYIFSN